jgi:RsiW-degrading membrane proteinase PrsW (M82 family)
MPLLVAVLLPILPGILWLVVVYRADRDPEPKHVVAATFVLGALLLVPCLVLERLADRAYPFLYTFDERGAAPPLGPLAIGCFLVVGPVEELAKLAAVKLYAWRHRAFDLPYDGMVYAAAAALGFASVENVAYVVDFDGPPSVRWGLLGLRTLVAVPGHLLFSALWGYTLGRKRARLATVPTGLAVAAAALLHGTYDFLLAHPLLRPWVILFLALLLPVVVRQFWLLRDAVVAPAASPPGAGRAGGPGPGADAT